MNARAMNRSLRAEALVFIARRNTSGTRAPPETISETGSESHAMHGRAKSLVKWLVSRHLRESTENALMFLRQSCKVRELEAFGPFTLSRERAVHHLCLF
jgi:hypothetical protein